MPMANQMNPSEQPLRICMVTDCFPPSIGGIEHHVYALSRELGRQGHKVTVVTHRAVPPDGQPAGAAVDIPDGVELVRLRGVTLRLRGGDPAIDPTMIGRFARTLRAGEFDVAHGHTVASPFVVALLWKAKRLGLPTVVTKHSMVERPNRSAVLSMWMRRAMLKVADGFTAHIAVSEAAASELQETRSKVFVIHNAIDVDMFRPDQALRQRTRAALGFEEDEVVIGFMSRFVASKGLLDLVDVAAELVEPLPPVRFLLVGDGPQRPQVERQIRQSGLQNRFVLTGFTPWAETPAYLNAMDVFAFPSHSEGFGLALLEAMACGLPAVTSDQSGTQDVIVDGRTALAVDSAEALKEGLLRLGTDSSLRAQMGRLARQAVEKDLGWLAVARRTVDVYRAAIRLEKGAAL